VVVTMNFCAGQYSFYPLLRVSLLIDAILASLPSPGILNHIHTSVHPLDLDPSMGFPAKNKLWSGSCPKSKNDRINELDGFAIDMSISVCNTVCLLRDGGLLVRADVKVDEEEEVGGEEETAE
jgi:hypothetical protein